MCTYTVYTSGCALISNRHEWKIKTFTGKIGKGVCGLYYLSNIINY